jgi:hypothetical protein
MFNFKLELLCNASVADSNFSHISSACHRDVTRTLNPRPGKKNEFHKSHVTVVNTHVAKHIREHGMERMVSVLISPLNSIDFDTLYGN